MLNLILAQVDPKTAEVAVVHIEKQPWVAVVVALSAICGVLLLAVVWGGKSLGPWIEKVVALALDKLGGMLAARGKESERDMQQVTETLGLKLENKIESVGLKLDTKIEAVGNSVAQLRSELVRNATKIGGAGAVLLLLTGMIASSPEGVRIEARHIVRPNLCNPRCPAGQQCMGRICTKMAAPKQPPRVAELPTASAPKTAPPPVPKDRKSPGPQSHNYATLTTTWTDGRDPFEVEPECNP